MSDNTLEPGSLEFKMNTAVLNMNNKLKEDGFNERERAFMWGMTITELRVFLTQVWEHLHNEKTVGHVGKELNPEPEKVKEKPKPRPPVQTPES